jgi:hypothetical protein
MLTRRPVDLEVAVADELARLRARDGEAEPVDDVVEPGLEHPQQLLARTPDCLRLLVVVAELLLEQAVVAARLLLLAQLQQVLALLDPATTVLARRVRAALDRALLRQAALALEEELHPLAAAHAALRSQISSHTARAPLDASPFPWADAVVRLRRHVPDGQDLESRGLERTDRGLTA